MRRALSSLLVVVILVAFFLVVAYLIYLGGQYVSGASDNIKAASIAAFVTVFTFTVGRVIEQNRERKSRVNSEKIEVYKQFFDLYFRIFSNQEIHGEEVDPNWLAKSLVAFQRDLLFWGSDPVIKSFLKFKEELSIATPKLSQANVDKVEILKVVILAAANLLKAMRQDIGYNFTSFSPRDLAILQLSGDDEETQRLIKSFAT